jgi:hypothetical protein
MSSDCLSSRCVGGVCQAPTCNDEVANGNETDEDCGGSCSTKCDTGQRCLSGTDCESKVCVGNRCQAPTCSDGLANGQETGRDCGGTSSCPRCPSGQACEVGGDCASPLYCNQQHTCAAPGCNNGDLDSTETDVDCGGDSCPKCGTDKRCSRPSDCVSLSCSSSRCQAPRCNDTIKNQGETDIDCGGTACSACGTNKTCAANSDCESKVCSGGRCAEPTCNDTAKNAQETDVNCGGPVCNACANGRMCSIARDCNSTVCSAMTCQTNQFTALYYPYGNNPTDNEIKPEIGIRNSSGAPVNSGDLRVIYYYSNEMAGDDDWQGNCYSVINGPSGADCSDIEVVVNVENGWNRLILGFKRDGFTVPNNGTTGGFQLHLHQQNYMRFYNETNDWSYVSRSGPIAENRKMVVERFVNGAWTTVYGVKPLAPPP